MKTIYFITEIHNEIGKGHYSRIFNLFKNLNYEKKFLCLITNSKNYLPDENVKYYHKNFFYEIDKNDLVFIDSYDLNEILSDILFPERVILLIDNDFDFKSRRYKALVIPINYNVQLKNLNEVTKIYKGKEFIILNNKLKDYRNNLTNNNLRKVVLSFGGSSKFFDHLKNIKSLIPSDEFELTIISKSKRMEGSIFYCEVEKYYELISKSDFLILSSGQSIYEALFLNKLIIPIGLTDNQNKNLEDLLKRGLFKFNFLPKKSETNKKVLHDFIKHYSCNENQIDYYNRTKEFLDLNGSKRINSILKKILND